jgi:uncharacterized PurR-regulated membrane protein YhhQ (DUF165 family)
MTIAFAGTQSAYTILKLVVSAYLGKVAYEVVLTPLTYAVVGWLKRREGVDTFDYGANFNPFHIAR